MTTTPAARDERKEAFAACPETNCDWGSFYLGWQARAELAESELAELRAELDNCVRSWGLLRVEIDAAIARAELAEKLLREIRAHNSSGLTKSMQDRIDAALHAEVKRLQSELTAIQAQTVMRSIP